MIAAMQIDKELLSENLRIIKDFRKKYHEGRIGRDVHEQMKDWEKIEAVCKDRNIDTDIIIIDDLAYNEMSASVIQNYIFQ